ncbi:MAG: MATE family efflux transporter [Tissierellia bacterium]|nr:MATE family efflux transporter [Tissierellia bacterium]
MKYNREDEIKINKDDERREWLLTKSTGSLIVNLCIPGIIGMIVIALYTFMDSVYAGQMISKEAMAAIGIAYPVTLINNGMATLFGIGGASVLSRAIGAKDKEKSYAVLPTVSFYIIAVSIITTVIGYLGAEKILRLSGAEGSILSQSIEYCKLIFLGSVLVNYTQASNMLIRGEGRMVKAMMIMGTGAIINIILDPIFIIAFPLAGVKSVAYATLISQFIQVVLTIIFFSKSRGPLHLSKPTVTKELTKPILAVGVTAMIMQLFAMVQQLLFYRVSSQYGGENFMILMSAFLRIQMFAFVPLWGMSQGFQPYVGTNYGAKEYKRLLKGSKEFIYSSLFLAILFFLPIQVFTKNIISLFIKDPSLVSEGIIPMRIFFSTFFLYGVMVMLGVYFQSIGDAKTAGVIIVGRNVLLFTPLIFIIPAIFGANGIWFVQLICDIIAIGYGIIKFVSHRNKIRTEIELSK